MTDYEKMVKAVSPPQDFQSTGKGMTDSEILDEVYRTVSARKRVKGKCNFHHLRKDTLNFIQQEWQKRDEQELVDQYNRNRKPEDYIVDVAEIERHRGLVIGEGGTVTDLK